MLDFLKCIPLIAVFLSAPAAAQVPPHTPGTICLTPDFWCWASEQGIPGEPCECPARESTGTPVAGVYG